MALKKARPNGLYTLGCDPELFLQRADTKELLPVCGLIGGTKDKPRPMEGMVEGFSVQEDNVMLEFNVPPATSGGIMLNYVQDAMTHVFSSLKEQHNAEIRPTSHVLFPFPLLASQGANIFGCSPDFDGYRNGENHAPVTRDALRDGNAEWRFAGGHIHVGYQPRGVPEFVVAQFADALIGLRSVPFDKQGKRRQLYGKAGRFRPTKYGMEYRTLSNFWLFNEGITRGVCNSAEELARFMHMAPLERIKQLHDQIPWRDVQTAINTEDIKLAGDLLSYTQRSLNIGEY